MARSAVQSALRRRTTGKCLTGTLFTVNVEPRMDSIAVPASYGAHRFWRNTSVASLSSGQVATFTAGTLVTSGTKLSTKAHRRA